jgi:methylthioribulose-1-phosphate dehydratase
MIESGGRRMASVDLENARRALIEVGAAFHARGWVPATSGNLSARLDDGTIAITASGRHKGRLGEADIMRVDAEGRAVGPGKPSAETPLHLQVYARYPAVGAVLHTHSPGGVALSRAFPGLGEWVIEGHELIKALPGQTTHRTRIALPIVDNDQDMDVLAAAIGPALSNKPPPHGYLIRGHGLYAWGADVIEAERVVEALEWLFAADLTERQYRQGVPV